ncbi:uncharacterized protein METZ01_LOCUS18571 [marine metagenome]|uniref:Uncharacterized protein n=1 Tax=marine metagenome TaxID=408172 RepID=A0A381PHN6_9ZZZZ
MYLVLAKYAEAVTGTLTAVIRGPGFMFIRYCDRGNAQMDKYRIRFMARVRLVRSETGESAYNFISSFR